MKCGKIKSKFYDNTLRPVTTRGLLKPHNREELCTIEQLELSPGYTVYVVLEPILMKSSLELRCSLTMHKRESIVRLICSNINKDSIAQFLEKNRQCTNVGSRIASNLVRVATQRIYSDPYRSFIEPVVNSIDAYNELRGIPSTTGKFGMGFFSLLYWLIPNGYMKIQSSYLEGDDVCNWGATISYQDDEFFFQLNYSDSSVSTKDNTGLLLEIYSSEENLNYYLLESMIEDTFSLVKDYRIYSNDRLINPLSFQGEDKEKLDVKIGMKKHDNVRSVYFRDYATGISLSTFFTKLLIPSISTKTIAKSLSEELTYSPPNTEAFMMISNDDVKIVSHFHIVIRGICIYTASLTREEIESSNKNSSTEGFFLDKRKYYTKYIWRLPDQTPLPVSRDDIIITDFIFYEAARNNLIELLRDCIAKEIPIDTLFLHLRKYVKYAVDNNVYRLIDEVENYLSKMNVYLVPRNYQYFYTKILKPLTGQTYVGVKTPQLTRLIDHVLELKGIKRNYDVTNKTIFLISGMKKNISINYTTAGLNGIIFVDEDFSKNPDWIKQIRINSVAILYDTKSTLPEPTIKLIRDNIACLYRWKENRVEGPPYMAAYMLKYADLIETIISREAVEGIYDSRENLYSYFYTVTLQLSLISRNEEFMADAFNIIYSSFYSLTNRNIPLSTTSAKLRTLFNVNLVDIEYMKFYLSAADRGICNRLPRINKSIDLKYVLNYLHLFYDNLANNNNAVVFIFNPIAISPFNAVYLDDPLYLAFISKLIVYLKNKPVDYGFIFSTIMINIYIEVSNNPVLLNKYLEYIYDELNHKYGIASIDNIINSHLNNPANADINILRKNLLLGIQLIKRVYNKDRYTIPYTIPELTYTYDFKATQLINYLFRYNVDSDRIDWLREITTFKSSASYMKEFQALEIAINEGTSKSYIESIITELTQNSIDAARGYLHNRNSILCNIGDKRNILEFRDGRIYYREYTGSENSEVTCMDLIYLQVGNMNDGRCAISLHDEVGISTAGIIAIMLPFYSTKKAEDVYSTGEMGTGFMNVYRQPYCDKVFINTYNELGNVNIKVTPEVTNNRVIDLRYQVNIGNHRGQGTDVLIILNENLNYESIITEALVFAYGFYPSINMRCYINDEASYSDRELLFENDIAVVSLREGPPVSSILLTNGIPYGWLKDFLPNNNGVRSYGSYNLIVDLKKEAYKPQQSRKRISFKKDIETLFNETMTLASILHAIKVNSNKDDSSIDSNQLIGIDYRGNVSNRMPQVHPKVIEYNYALIVIAVTSMNILSISDLLVNMIFQMDLYDVEGSLTEDVIRPYLSIALNFIVPVRYKVVRNYYTDIAIRWFSNKTIGVNVTKESKLGLHVPDSVISFLNAIVTHAWNEAKRLISTNELQGLIVKNRPPMVKYANIEKESVRGYYSTSKHIIVLNENYYELNTPSSVKAYIDSEDSNLIRSDVTLRKLIGNEVVSVTLVHEFLHALRNENHDTDAHSGISFVLHNVKYDLGFDAAANKLWSNLIASWKPSTIK